MQNQQLWVPLRSSAHSAWGAVVLHASCPLFFDEQSIEMQKEFAAFSVANLSHLTSPNLEAVPHAQPLCLVRLSSLPLLVEVELENEILRRIVVVRFVDRSSCSAHTGVDETRRTAKSNFVHVVDDYITKQSE